MCLLFYPDFLFLRYSNMLHHWSSKDASYTIHFGRQERPMPKLRWSLARRSGIQPWQGQSSSPTHLKDVGLSTEAVLMCTDV